MSLADWTALAFWFFMEYCGECASTTRGFRCPAFCSSWRFAPQYIGWCADGFGRARICSGACATGWSRRMFSLLSFRCFFCSAMAGLAAYLLYWQLGSYVIYTEMEEREERVGVVATAMATSYAAEATLRTAARRPWRCPCPRHLHQKCHGRIARIEGRNRQRERNCSMPTAGSGEEPVPGAGFQRWAAGVAGRGRAPDSRGTHSGFRGCSHHSGIYRHAGAGTRPDPIQRACVRKAETKRPEIPIVINTQRLHVRAANRNARSAGSQGRESVRQADHGHRGA